MVFGLWALVGWMVWELVWPGPSPRLHLEFPATEEILATDRPILVQGRIQRARSLTCNGAEVHLGPGGRFRAAVPGPTRAGMYLLGCEARNQRGRPFNYPFARLAGPSVPLGDPIEDAVIVAVPLKALTAKGGLFGPLAAFFAEKVAPAAMAVAERFTTTWEGARIGPLRLSGLSLLSVEAGGSEELVVTLGLEGVRLDLDFPHGWAPSTLPAKVRRLMPELGGKREIALGKTLPLSVTIAWTKGQRPRLSVGLLSSDLLRSALKFRFMADVVVASLGALSKKWQADLDKALNDTEAVISALDRIHKGLEARLTRVGALLPPLPSMVSPDRPSVCFSLSLSRLRSDRGAGLVTLHLAAQVLGVTRGGKRCADARPEEISPLPLGHHSRRRLVLGPPWSKGGATQVGKPRNGTPLMGPSLLVAHDLLNAYLATLWVSGSLRRVPVDLPDLRDQGFDIRSLAYSLPPVVTTSPAGHLVIEVPELGVDLGTIGEPRRLFYAHLRVPLALSDPAPGKLRLGAMRGAPPEVHLRCEEEGVGRSGQPGRGCPTQSRRFESLVNVATELAFVPELALPPLAVEAALPSLSAAGVTIRVGRVVTLPKGLQVELEVQ